MALNRLGWDDPRARLVGGLALVLVVLIGYLPALRGGFVWDDDVYVTHNQLLTAEDGLKRIWFSRDAPSQYFPLTYTTLRLEHALWGFDPRGYHLVNIALHGLNAVLFWRLLAALSIPGGWLAAVIFAVHPVNVESVAWISELKNVLSTFFYLLALMSWLRFARQQPGARSWGYPAALLFFALALFSKTTTVTLPVIVLLLGWFTGEKIGWKRVVQIAPFFVLAGAMGLVTLWWEENQQGTAGAEFYLAPVQRLILAGRALWFYAAKLVWPSSLSFSYPRWVIDAGNPWNYCWPAAAVLAVFVLWRLRDRLGKGPLAAVLFFVVTLVPVTGIFSLYTFRYTFVADHYQYVACMGLIALAASLSRTVRKHPALQVPSGVAFAVVIAVFGYLTWGQAATYRDAETLWRHTLRVNADSWIAHNNLGKVLAERGRLAEAIDHVQQSLRLNPDNLEARINLTVLLASAGDLAGARAQHREAVRLGPDSFLARYSFGVVLGSSGLYDEAAAKFQEALRIDPASSKARSALGITYAALGRFADAASQYREALRLDPHNERARAGLAQTLGNPGRCSARAPSAGSAATGARDPLCQRLLRGRKKRQPDPTQGAGARVSPARAACARMPAMERSQQLIYLDNGATSFPKPPAVAAAMSHFLLEVGGSPGRSGHRLSQEAARVVFECREALAALIGAPDSKRVAFTLNATQALNTAIYGTLRQGDRVVTTSMEHNSVMRPLRDLERRRVIELSVVACDRTGRLDPGLLEEAVRARRPRLVAVVHASNVTGSVVALREIGGICRAASALLLVDAAQSAGALPIDVEADRVDLLAFTGHKSLFGPQGTGGLWAREGIDPEPLVRGGTGSNSELEEQPEFWPDRLESGTQNAVGLAGLHAGLRFIATEGVAAIHTREEALVRRLLAGLEGVPGLRTHGPDHAQERTPVVSVTFDGLFPSEAGFLLEEGFNVLTRVGLHCSPAAHRTIGTYPQGTVRLTPGYFTTVRDIDAAIEGCRYLAAKKGGAR